MKRKDVFFDFALSTPLFHFDAHDCQCANTQLTLDGCAAMLAQHITRIEYIENERDRREKKHKESAPNKS